VELKTFDVHIYYNALLEENGSAKLPSTNLLFVSR